LNELGWRIQVSLFGPNGRLQKKEQALEKEGTRRGLRRKRGCSENGKVRNKDVQLLKYFGA